MRLRPHLHPHPAELGLAILLVASFAVRLPFVRDTLHDDTFISMRYAERLAQGAGLTFNDGERVEGFTNFLWTILLAAADRLGLDLVAIVPWLSVIPALGLVYLVYRFGVREGGLPARAWALVAPLLVALHPFLLAESVGGLETTFFVALVFAGFDRAVAERRSKARAGGAAALFALATLVRPEGTLAFALLVAARLIGPGSEARARGVGRDLGIYVLLVLPLLCFRLGYYGDWVPNTFHAKVGWSMAQLERGWRYLRDYGLALAPIPVLVLAAAGVGRGWRAVAAASVVTTAAYAVAVGGDFAPTGRFVLVAAPFVALLVQSAALGIAGWLTRRRLGIPTALACVLVAAGWSLQAEARRLESRAWPASYRHDLEARRYLGRWFAATLPPDATIAVGSIGAIGYYGQRRILDTFGLTNVEIGRLQVEWMGRASAGHEKGDADVVLRAAPEVIVFDRAFLAPRRVDFEEFLAEARSPTEQLLSQDPRLYESYGLRSTPTPAGVLHWLERVP